MYSSIYIVIVSKYCRFEYVKEAIRCGVEDYLTLPDEKDELFEVIKKIKQKKQLRISEEIERRKYLFRRYLEDSRQLNSEELQCLISSDTNRGLYQVIVIRLLPPYRKRYHRGDDLIMLKGMKVINSSLSEFHNFLTIKMRMDICVLLWGNAEDLKETKRYFDDFLSEINVLNDTFFKMGAWIAVGSAVEKSTEIILSYQSALDILQERFFGKNIDFLEKKRKMGKEDIFSAAMKQALINAVDAADTETLQHLLTKLKQNILMSSAFEGIDLYMIYKGILSIFYLELDRAGVALSNGNDYEFMLREFDFFWTIDDIFDTLLKHIVTGLEEWAASQEDSQSAPVRKAKRYIREFFGMPLTLEEVSNYVGFNASYFSDYFKKETGQTFSQYLADVRIGYAKQLLLEESMGLEDIAESVGYGDKKYFAKIFKKKTGMTPREYKRKNG